MSQSAQSLPPSSGGAKTESAAALPPASQQAAAPAFEARKLFADEYEKTSKFDFALGAECLKGHIEFGKMTISHLFVMNAGGLAALVALHPLLRETNQLWLLQQLWSAIGFGLGLGAATCAALVYGYGLDQGADIYLGRGHSNEATLRQLYLTTTTPQALRDKVVERAIRRAHVAIRLFYISIAISGLCAAFAAVLLAFRLGHHSVQ